jgi:single-stranded-DNA-specific exonuclease
MSEPAPAFLGVESSATGRRWIGPTPAQDRHAQALIQTTGLPDALCRVLAAREVEGENAAAFLAPSLRELMPDPSSLKDMDKAATRFLAAVSGRQRIAIFADYDVDGGTSAALLISWLRDLGLTATLYIPDRIIEGYGPNEGAMAMLAKDHDLIVCVDCGTLSHDPIKAAAPVDVIVLDHHQGGETLPLAHCVVNPNRQDEVTELTYLCAAGVVFMLLVAVNRLMRSDGKAGPDLLALLDLVALATVADVAPLQGLNRAFVQQGLKIMGQRKRVGLTALADVARMDTAPSAYHLGFLLGPRVNAGGRIGKADLGARLLSTDDPHEASALAERLEDLNKDRREIEEQVRLQAMEQAEARGFDAPLVWAAGEGWHPGVVGIVASRLKDAANRPALVIGLDGEDGKGSGRSISGIDLGASIARLVAEGLLEKGGGHKMAAGLSVSRDKLAPAMARLTELLAAQGSDNAGPSNLRVTGVLAPRAVTVELIEQLEQAGPFGSGAPAPRFALPSVRVTFAKRAGENHLRLTFQDEGGSRIDAIAFRAFDSQLGPLLEGHNGAIFNVAGRLEVDSWGGRKKPKLRLEDAVKIGG